MAAIAIQARTTMTPPPESEATRLTPFHRMSSPAASKFRDERGALSLQAPPAQPFAVFLRSL